MDLIIWRHADAGDPYEELALDLSRPLSRKGERQAKQMSAWLEARLPQSARVVCSPALRCVQTVEFLGRNYKRRDELSPDAGGQSVLDLVQRVGARSPLLVVGHQPSLGEAIALLMSVPTERVSVRKGSVWWLRPAKPTAGCAMQLRCVQSPDML